ncbi:zinc transport system ATP-binding protein [Desulfocicer vacuolatum DSM 3385]|uniref:Zinc transport system ATP-binding protein n=1 Tax=Desulfocicer vacuolatum DSM 3385 TaxID=1121400 RepID=A0A1W2E517_9BACT|nr:metal ABC transporter ATP-binding protein [Desulfocicer vacuolatum]SMD04795.1 zinc transport system ATP-binding protein [Desulfocicer vacuolatum DSM 3385]
METPQVVEIKNMSFAYQARNVLKDVNLTVPQGDFATIVGPNGGGKTTLLKLLLGLLPPSSGTIKIFGTSPAKSRVKIGYMPQYSHLDMQFPVTVMDVALMGRLARCKWGRYSSRDRDAAATALEEVKMDTFKETHFNALSGGQKQRVLIARALCSEPELLLLDEPTSNIDQESEKDLFNILQRLNHRMTILLVSHDLGFTSQVVKSVICVNRQVVIHPTTTIDGTMIKDIYGGDLKMIRHDHRCCEMGHMHD